MFKLVTSMAAGAALATAAVALAYAQPVSPASVQAGAYNVDPYHTQVVFTVSHFGFTTFTGTFSSASGSLSLDPKNPAASKLKVTIPVSSALTTSPKLTEELKDPNWFDAAKFPEATFVANKVTVDGAGKATVTGDLTLHGITKPLTLQVAFQGAGVNPVDKKYTVGFEATGDIIRTEFGVKTYAPYVGDKVHLTIAGAFEKAE